jgi:hypothetical protein
MSNGFLAGRTWKVFLDDASRNNVAEPIRGNYLKVIRASNGLANALISFNGPVNSASAFTLVRGAEFRVPIEQITLQYTNQPGAWLELFITDGDMDIDYPENIDLTVGAIVAPVKVRGGEEGEPTQVPVNTGAAQVIAANPARMAVIVTNHSTLTPAFWGRSSAVTTANGGLIGEGVTRRIDGTAAVWMIAGSALTVSVSEVL